MENASSPIITTRQGALCGITEGDVQVWRAIPYAAPPVGALR